MKKFYVASVIATIVILFSYCHTSKKATAAPVAAAPGKITYEGNVKLLIAGSCTPCHIPANGGMKKAFDNYEAVKSNVDDMIHRVGLNPGERGFMPSKKPKLSDSSIAVIKQWKEDGLMEK
jgi:hypothetical protein